MQPRATLSHPPSHSQPNKRSFNHGGPPPAKRFKGNPVITHYPLPPGYEAPTPPWQQQEHQRQHQRSLHSFNHAQVFPPTTHQQSIYSQSLVTLSPASHSQQDSYQQSCHQPLQANYYRSPLQSTAPSWPTPASGQQGAPSALWFPRQLPPGTRRHMSAPVVQFNSNGIILDGNGDPMPPLDTLAADCAEQLEEEFGAECYFARHPADIDPKLSLGLIDWKAARPTTRSLPSTFKEAELEVIAPRPPKAAGESVSDHLAHNRLEEALLSIRQTDAWVDAKDDLIFREFALVCANIISWSELRLKYRGRSDVEWERADRGFFRPLTPTMPQPPTCDGPSSRNTKRHSASQGRARQRDRSEDSASNASTVDEVERNMPYRRSESRSTNHSRSGSVNSQGHGKFVRPKPLPVVRDKAQEDILAALGVTGSPRMVYETPGPAYGQPPPTKSHRVHSRTNSVDSAHDSALDSASHLRIIAPPPLQQQPSTSSASRSSDVDAAATDCASPIESEMTPRPTIQPQRDFSRKRSYADSHTGGFDDCILEEDEEDTPRPKKQFICA